MPEIGLPELTAAQWSLVFVSAFGLGVAKSGFAGVGLFHVVVFAFIFGAKKSTGYVLPMLIFGDVCAVAAFRQHRESRFRRQRPGRSRLSARNKPAGRAGTR